jgi:hypothetical protein
MRVAFSCGVRSLDRRLISSEDGILLESTEPIQEADLK